MHLATCRSLNIPTDSADEAENEIAKQRVAHISEVWSVLYASEMATTDLLGQIAALRAPNAPAALTNLLPVQQKSRKMADRVRASAEVNRFWLGEDLYNGVRSYYNIQMEMMKAFEKNDSDRFQRLEEERQTMRVSFLDFVRNPLRY